MAAMALRTKTLLIICLTFGLLIGSFYLAFSTLFMAHYEMIETSLVRKDVERGISAFINKASDLAVKVEDWAKYDDTFKFVSDRNQSYIDGNLNFESLVNLHLNHIIYFDKDGQIFEGREIRREEGRVVPLSDEAKEKLGSDTPLGKLRAANEAVTGLVALSDRVLFVASLPIQDSARQERPNGVLLKTIAITPEVVEKLGEQTKLSLSLSRLDEEKGIMPEALTQKGDPIGRDTIVVQPVDEQYINGYGVISDIYGKPILLMKVVEPRDIYRQTVQTRDTILLLLLVGGGVSTAFLLVALNYSVVVRLSKLSRELTDISQRKDVSRRVSPQGDDEIGSVAANVNGMLAALEEAEERIIHAKNVAEDASRSKSQFVANVSHELRTPINCVINVLRSLFRAESSPARRQQLAMAADSSFGLLALINDVLDFSKVESGKLVLDDHEFSIDDMVREALRTVAPKAYEGDSVELLCVMRSALSLSCRGDAQRLRQVLINLMGNAIKFTKEGAVTLTVGLTPSERADEVMFEVSVRDTGIGIPRDKLVSVFEPFVQADGSIARNFQGTGLGLTISKEYIEAMGGEISVTSREGKGSEFSLSVPLKAEQCVENAGSYGIPEKITVVSNNHHLVLMVEDLLCPFSCHVAHSNGASDTDGWRESAALIIDTASVDDTDLHRYLMTASGGPRTVLLFSPMDFERKESYGVYEGVVLMSKPVISEDLLRALSGEEVKDDISSSLEAHLLSDCYVEGLGALNILIADDLETNQVILSSMLEEVGHKVTVVSDGRELLSSATNYDKGSRPPFNLILTDVQMPGLDGITVTKMIRSKERMDGLPDSHRVPIVAVTAHAMSDEIEEMKGAGVDAVVTKPIDPRQLSKVLESLFKKSIAFPEVKPLKRVELPKSALEELLYSIFPDSDDIGRFDPGDLIDRTQGNPRLIRTTLRVFFREIDSLLLSLEAKVKGGDKGEIAKGAHALRGSLLSASLGESAAIAGRLEQSARDEEEYQLLEALWISLSSSVASVVASLQGAYREIEKILDEGPKANL